MTAVAHVAKNGDLTFLPGSTSEVASIKEQAAVMSKPFSLREPLATSERILKAA